METTDSAAPLEPQLVTPGQLEIEPQAQSSGDESDRIMAMLEAIVYVTDEPLTAEQIAGALGEPRDRVMQLLEKLVAEYARPCHGLAVREVAGGYKMSTKPEHHEAIRAFVKRLQPPLKLSIAALETLSVVAYKQPVTGPEILEIRGVQGAGVLKTLLDRKLITTAGRKNVIGRPILYKTTKEFLVQFGLKDLNELPTLKEFEELKRMALGDDEPQPAPSAAPVQPENQEQSPVVAAPEPEGPEPEGNDAPPPAESAAASDPAACEEAQPAEPVPEPEAQETES
jgi:segregation and condensation protein B